jgi:hypothetical protein
MEDGKHYVCTPVIPRAGGNLSIINAQLYKKPPHRFPSKRGMTPAARLPFLIIERIIFMIYRKHYVCTPVIPRAGGNLSITNAQLYKKPPHRFPSKMGMTPAARQPFLLFGNGRNGICRLPPRHSRAGGNLFLTNVQLYKKATLQIPI